MAMDYAQQQAVRFLAACWLVGAVGGVIVGALRQRRA